MTTDSFVPLYKAHIPPELGRPIETLLASGQIADGPEVARFEDLLRAYVGNPWLTACGDISTALTLCLFQAGVRPHDDVLMSPLVCLATSCPVRNLFANIRWCDVDPRTGNLDPSHLGQAITAKTKAVVVYHWAGNPADLDAIRIVAQAHHLAIIEDAGEALGAMYHDAKLGATGSEFTVFSFYPNRHITTIEGAAIACSSEEHYNALRWLKRYGIHQPTFRQDGGEINPQSDIRTAGWNSYLNRVAGLIGVEQMAFLPQIVARHQDNGRFYDEAFANLSGIEVLRRPPNSHSAYWVYTFLAEDRDSLLKTLRRHGIQASQVHFRNDAYSCFGQWRGSLPGADYFSTHCLSIPCGWWVSDADRARIADIVCRATTTKA